MEKIKIELTPYAAMTILKLLSEFEPDMEREKLLQGLKDSYEEYKNEVVNKITDDQLLDAGLQVEINQSLGTDPPA